MGDYLPPVIAELKADLGDFTAKIARAKALINSLNTSVDVRVGVGSVVAAGTAAEMAGRRFRILGTGIRLTGAAIHWLIAAGSEFLAVFIPAAIALGSAFMVALQGSVNVATHMHALYIATEATANMFGVTVGSALHLGSALQRVQNQADPIVYSILGGAVMALHDNFQSLATVGLQVTRVMQGFTAHLVQDFQSGGAAQEIHALLANMVADLVAFGQVLGNVGHALLNFAAAMPGLAEVLLRIIDGISQVILWVSQLPPILITVAMGMEEFWRWGSLVTRILTVIPGLLTGFIASGLGLIPVLARLAQIFQALLLVLPRLGAALGMGLINLGRFIPAAGEAGVAIGGFSEEVSGLIGKLPLWQLALGAVAVGGYVFLAIKALSARTAIQQLTDSMQQTVDKAQGMRVFTDIANNMGTLGQKMAQVTTTANGTSAAMTTMGGVVSRLAGPEMTAAGAAVAQLNAGMTQQQRDLLNAAQAVTFISHKYGVDWVGALQLGTEAGVQWDQGIGKMSAAADINMIKVAQLVRGYQLMGQSAGAVGKDTTVLGIEAALAATKIEQLTQAWQAFMQQITGGTSSLATFEQGLQNMGTVAASTSGKLFAATGNMTQSTNQFALSLTKFTGKSAQDWQNFDQVVTTGAESFISWMQTAGAMGVVSGQQMTGAIKGVVAQLIPFATHSAAARVALASLAAQTGQTVAPTNKALQAWIKGGMSAKDLAKFVNDATLKMGDMAKVAQNLGAVMQNDLVAMFDKAKIAASGLPDDLNSLSAAIASNNTPASIMHQDILKVIGDLGTMHVSVPTITALLNTMGIKISESGVKALIASGQLSTMNGTVHALNGSAVTAAGSVNALAGAINALHSKTVTITYQSVGIGSRGGHTGNGPLAGGTDNAIPGAHLVGEHGPEMVLFGGGEQVVSNETLRHASQGTLPSLPGRGSGAGGVQVLERQPIVVNLDGDVIYKSVKESTLTYDVQNNTRGRYGGASGKLARG